ncbi:hypothetical protein CELL2_05195 [Thermotoga sp. Cell2]|nr:hypothetical protein CELL2_05195 [Thermotoga sp. Cell2]
MDILKDDGTVVLLDEMLDELYESDNFEGVPFPRLFVFIMEETAKREGSIEKAYNCFKGNIGYYENYIAQIGLIDKKIDELLQRVDNEQQREILLQVKEKKLRYRKSKRNPKSSYQSLMVEISRKLETFYYSLKKKNSEATYQKLFARYLESQICLAQKDVSSVEILWR